MSDRQKTIAAITAGAEAKSLELMVLEYEDVIAKVSMGQAKLYAQIFRDGETVLFPDGDLTSMHLADSGLYEILDLDGVTPVLQKYCKAVSKWKEGDNLAMPQTPTGIGLQRVITPEGELMGVLRRISATGNIKNDFEDVEGAVQARLLSEGQSECGGNAK